MEGRRPSAAAAAVAVVTLRAAGTLFLALGCGAGPVGPRAFRLDVYDAQLGVVYEYDALETRMGEVQPPVAIGLSGEDVSRYRVLEEPGLGVELVLSESASRRLGAALRGLHEAAPFAVYLEGRRLYVGVVYTPMGAAAIRTPILHVEEREGRLTLRIDEHIGAGFGDELPAGVPPWPRRVDVAVLRRAFRAVGALEVE